MRSEILAREVLWSALKGEGKFKLDKEKLWGIQSIYRCVWWWWWGPRGMVYSVGNKNNFNVCILAWLEMGTDMGIEEARDVTMLKSEVVRDTDQQMLFYEKQVRLGIYGWIADLIQLHNSMSRQFICLPKASLLEHGTSENHINSQTERLGSRRTIS